MREQAMAMKFVRAQTNVVSEFVPIDVSEVARALATRRLGLVRDSHKPNTLESDRALENV